VRTFEDTAAIRSRTPVILGVVGPSGSGKTFSALRLATGIQRVSGGDIYVVDTEARRALHYAPLEGEKADPSKGTFDFRHLPFGAPFGPLDYLAAFEHCYKKGARTIITDSTSHEHEGVGGVLETHEAELVRMAGTDYKRREKLSMLAWQKPKSQRKALISRMLQMECNFIFLFRAKEKIKPVKGGEPIHLGWQPIAGSEWIYEMLQNFLLVPGSQGTPKLQSEHEAERELIKVPLPFRGMWQQPRQLSEDAGEAIARWAEGKGVGKASDVTVGDLMQSYSTCDEPATYRALEQTRSQLWARASSADKSALKKAADDASKRIAKNAESGIAGDSEPPANVPLVGDGAWEAGRE
jgi:energy-coupling factor transporter ATP-binding protein EcfA2